MARDGFKFYESVNGVWLTKEVPFKYMRREIFDINIVFSVVVELKSAFEKDDAEDIIDEQIIGTYGWEYVQQALFQILFDDNNKKETYSSVADIFWSAVLKNQKMRKKTTVALLYYRLGNVSAPYENNIICSITSELFNLDYANSEYNPLRDEKIEFLRNSH